MKKTAPFLPAGIGNTAPNSSLEEDVCVYVTPNRSASALKILLLISAPKFTEIELDSETDYPYVSVAGPAIVGVICLRVPVVS